MNLDQVKKDFPILTRTINDVPLVYLDNAATTQKPAQVIEAISDYYRNHNANVHRGIHSLSEEASEMYDKSRQKVAEFIGAVNPKEIIFSKGTTDSLNQLALTWARRILKQGDKIVLTDVEHHSNFVPWQVIAREKNVDLEIVRPDLKDNASLLSLLKEIMNDRVKIITINHASNVTGTINPIHEISKLAHKYGAYLIVDGAQAVPHIPINVHKLGCDFYCFSGHKMLGPTGIGVTWSKQNLLEASEPFSYGGGMIDMVGDTSSTWAELPEKFEAGTPNVEGAIGLSTAISYLQDIGMQIIEEHEKMLNKYLFEKIKQIEGLKIIGLPDPSLRTGLVSFTLEKIHSHDLASILNGNGIAVRSGHHCAMPLHNRLGLSSSTRVSFYLYNTKEDINKLIEGLNKAIKILR